MLIVYYQGNYPIGKDYKNFEDWNKTSLEIIEDTLRRGKEGDIEVDFDDFNAYRDIVIVDRKTGEEWELSEDLTIKQINEILEKYID